jgi:hypothetical protein
MTASDEQLSGRAGIAGWHEELLARGAVAARWLEPDQAGRWQEDRERSGP